MAANYLSSEFTACGQNFNGMGICTVQSGQDFSSVMLSVQGYYQGTIRFVTDCVTNASSVDSVVYTNNESVPFGLSGPAYASCGVSFVVSPQYPNQKNQKFVINSFEGQLYIRVLPGGIPWKGFVNKVVAGANPTETLQLPLAGPSSEVLFEGCGIKFDQVLPTINGILYVPLSTVLPGVPQQACVMSGAYWVGPDAVRLTWFIDGYDPKFIPLPVPSLIQSGSSLAVQADDNTSVIALDSSYVVNNAAKFKFDPKVAHTLRLLTIGGRTAMGYFVPSSGWTWHL